MERIVVNMFRKSALSAVLFFIGFCLSIKGFGQTSSSNWCDYFAPNGQNVCNNVFNNPNESNIQSSAAPGIIPYVFSNRSTYYPGYDASAYESYAYIFNRTEWQKGAIPFRMLKPKNYNAPENATKTYPLIIMFHGKGEYGQNNHYQLLHGGSQHLAAWNNGTYDGFVIFTQGLGDSWVDGNTWLPDEELVQSCNLIDFLKSDPAYRIDPDKIFAHGLSAGGSATLSALYTRPDLFAGALVLAGNTGANYTTRIANLAAMPIWWFHGSLDNNPDAALTQSAYQILRTNGGIDDNKTKYTLYVGRGHDIWPDVYGDPRFFPYVNSLSKRKIYVMSQNPVCDGQSGKLGLSPGYASYQWFKDGLLLSGSTSSILSNINEDGNYHCRFQRLGSSQYFYSDTVKMLLKPTISSNNGYILPSPAGSNVTLTANQTFEQYGWSNGASTSSTTVTTTGDYSVRGYKNGCWTSFSNPAHIEVGNSTLPPAAPTNLIATAVSSVSVNLNWTDNATNEVSYEIYRSNSTGGPYTFVDFATANATSYTVQSLSAATNYYFKVRAVSLLAGSLSNEAQAKTLGNNDMPAPTAPVLSFAALNENGLTIKWTVPSSSYPIRRYALYYNNTFVAYTSSTSYFYGQVNVGNNYSFYVLAEDINGSWSSPSETKTLKYDGKGLFASKYQLGGENWQLLPDYSIMTPNAEGWIGAPQMSSSDNGISITNKLTNTDLVTDSPKNYFGLNFRGYINIDLTKLGVYRFALNSDDGSNLYINGVKVVKADSTHDGSYTRWGTYNFTSGGWHAIKIDYFEKAGGQGITVRYASPGTSLINIPESVLSTVPGGIVNTPSTLPSATISLTPSNTSTTDKIKTSISVNATSVSNTSYFELYRIRSSTDPIGSSVWTKLASFTNTGGNSFSFTYEDTQETPTSPLLPNTKYYYAIKAINNNGETGFRFQYQYWSHTTPNISITIPAAPTALVVAKTFDAIKSGSFTDNSANETGFEVWRSLTENGSYSLVFKVKPNATSFKDSTALANTNYYYKVRSYNQAGTSAFSNVDNTLPSITTYYSKSTGSLNVLGTWGANTDGSGPPPVDFTSANLTFIYSNRTNETLLDAPWTVNGSNSQIIVETGKKLTIENGVTLSGTLVVKANAEVKFNSIQVPTITSVDATSTLTFGNGSTIPDIEYGNLKLQATGTKSLPALLKVRGSLTLEGTTTIQGSPSVVELGGNLIYTNHQPTLESVSVSFQGVAHEIQGTNGAVQLAKLESKANSEIKVTGVTQLTLGGPGLTGYYPGLNSILDLSTSDLYITGNGALNPNNTTSDIKSNSSSLNLNSSSTLESHLSLAQAFNTLKNITVYLTGPSFLALEKDVSLTGTLKLGAGELKTKDRLVLVSNISGTARIAKVEASAFLTGKVQWQRLLGPDKKQTYMTVSSPIAGQKISTLKETITTINGLGGSGVPSVTTLNEATNGWTGITDPNTIMQPGKGYRVFVRTADLTYPNNSAFVNITGLPTIGDGQGSNTAPFQIPLQKAGQGWNLIGNPFPCEIDWDAASGWNKTAIDNAFYVWDSKNGIYQSYVSGVGTGGLTSVINSGQAFMVKANVGNSVVSLTEEVKVTPPSSPKYYRLADIPSLLRIYMTNADSISDEAVVRLKEEATVLFDSEYDALKYKGSTLNISTTAGLSELSINSLNYFDPNTSIPVNIQSTKGGDFSLSFAGAESFEKEFDLYLHDKEKGSYTDLKTSSTYSFSYPSAFSTKSRFELVLNNKTASQVLDLRNEGSIMNELTVYPNPATHSTTFHFGLSKGSDINIEVYNLNGQLVYGSSSAQSQGLHDTVWHFEKDKVTKGIYFYKVNVNGEIHDGKIVVQ